MTRGEAFGRKITCLLTPHITGLVSEFSDCVAFKKIYRSSSAGKLSCRLEGRTTNSSSSIWGLRGEAKQQVEGANKTFSE